MYEVEVKARLRDKAKTKKKLESLGCKFSSELHQVDRVFIPNGFPFPEPLGTPVLRVRKQNDRFLFTLKITQTGRLDCIERELEIKDGNMMIEIINLLKFYEVPTVDKKRIKTNLKGVEIVLDTVKHLGNFIEAEKIVTTENSKERKKIQQKLYTLLTTFGIAKEDVIIDGKYTYMLAKKLEKKKKK
jgi:predicted adenylyl cyclase CyaB